MGQIITTQNLVAIKEVRHAGQPYIYTHIHIYCLLYIKLRLSKATEI